MSDLNLLEEVGYLLLRILHVISSYALPTLYYVNKTGSINVVNNIGTSPTDAHSGFCFGNIPFLIFCYAVVHYDSIVGLR